MVRLIMSGSGEGKTKQLIELMENAVEQEVGCMVCIEPKRNMSFNLYAGNYDISHIFIDNLCKVAHSSDEREIGEFLNWLDAFSSPLNVKVTVTISGSPDSATDTMRKYM